MKQKREWILLLAALMLGAVFVPLVSATNETNVTSLKWFGEFDEWAGQKDMSAYSIIVPTVPIKKMDAETAKAYPGVEVISPDMKFPTGNNHVDVKKSSMKAAKIIFDKPASKTDTMAKTGPLDPSVVPEYGYFDWYWTQDTIVTQNISIYNNGSSTASGLVYFVSIEDGFGTPVAYTNLAPGTNQTVSIPFQVIASRSSVGIKPMGFFITVGPTHIVTWSGQLELNAIEKYNNDASHLPDPDGGDNLETSDLYHFPFNEGYAFILEAATAADNTSSPFETATKLNTYVNDTMHYINSNTNLEYAASDLYVKNHGYEGVCDEYATMDITFSRSLGIPSRFLTISWVNETGTSFGHGILEHRIAGTWVHSDPTWHTINNPQIYKQGNNTHMNLTKYTDADDNRFTADPAGVCLLNYEDMVADRLGELPEYN
ncbi:MAG: transglutaminase family protein [Methanoregula sp.]|jgi:transglutaminase-like putative cysteine protease|nr:transglutaminase family protein [Methanoregula sp.]